MTATAQKPSPLSNARPCPFCGGQSLQVTPWWDDSGEYDAIECQGCLGSAPAVTWNRRASDQPARDVAQAPRGFGVYSEVRVLRR